jgi:hypothetical protein
MPKQFTARPPLDADEERHVRKLAHSVHAPADWIVHAKMIARSWDGQRTRAIADALGCHRETVHHRLHAFNARGLDGLGMLPGSGRKAAPHRAGAQHHPGPGAGAAARHTDL